MAGGVGIRSGGGPGSEKTLGRWVEKGRGTCRSQGTREGIQQARAIGPVSLKTKDRQVEGVMHAGNPGNPKSIRRELGHLHMVLPLRGSWPYPLPSGERKAQGVRVFQLFMKI